MRLPRRILSVVAIAAVAATASVVLPLATDAASATTVTAKDYPKNLLISDTVMYYTGTATAASIQSFLNSKGKACKVSGSVLCLKSYTVDTPSTSTGVSCQGMPARTNQTAAQIIYNVSQACGVNPQAILVTLQKEQSLVTSATATAATYKIAMGYGCSDGRDCDNQYPGFFLQVLNGTSALREKPAGNVETPTLYPIGVKSDIRYSPLDQCKTETTVTPANAATSRLYQYTPYVPNAGLLAGKPTACSVAGNLNFWKIFNEWFGPSVLSTGSPSYVQAIYEDLFGRAATSADVYTQAKAVTVAKSRASLATRMLASTTFRTALIKADYEHFLSQTPSTTTVNSWLSRLAKNNPAADDLSINFVAGNAYYAKVGGTASGFVTALYNEFLGTTPTSSQLTLWTKRVASEGRTKVATSFVHSTGYSTIRAKQLFSSLLPSVTPTNSQVSTYAKTILKSGYYATEASFLATTAYLNKSTAAYPSTP
jgi:hypothetical protein